jgi:RimJ/RimL family protein N-acetyltransferase
MNHLSVREMQHDDITHIVNYWQTADADYLRSMGADPDLVPAALPLTQMLAKQLELSYEEKQSYGIIWLLDGKPVGHCNVNKIVFGKEAYMHLHIWDATVRRMGLGLQFVQLTVPYFFKNMQLQTLYGEPYALNPAPNKLLPKAGFRFVRTYVTVPGSLNFEQQVNLWEMKAEG